MVLENRSGNLSVVRVLLLTLLACSVLGAQEKPAYEVQAEYAKANYTKHEYRVPMRDGVHLYTAVYVPKDSSASNRYPIMLMRMPYGTGPYGEQEYPKFLAPSETLLHSGYIFAHQDVRGKFMSEGEFVHMKPRGSGKSAETDESTDAYDTVDWLVKNVAFNDGRVGMWGISYLGFFAAAGMIDAHPALKAVSPQAPMADVFLGDDFHHNGALWLAHAFFFLSVFDLPRSGPAQKFKPREFDFGTKDGYSFYMGVEPLSKANEQYLHGHIALWNEIIAHPSYDAFWQSRSAPQYLRNIKPAVLVTGGWFDAEDLFGTLHTYEAAAQNAPKAPVVLAMGPWAHVGWFDSDGESLGDIRFGSKTSQFYRERIEAPFFEHFLKNKDDPRLPGAYVFETGSNQWRTYDTWPPRNSSVKSLYLGENGTLAFEVSKASAGFDEYVSDPAKPVPYLDGTSVRMAPEYMTADQRLQGRRTDVLVYQTEPLKEDITLAGPVRPSLFVSTTGTDSDWVVKLIDVYPDDAPDPVPNPTRVHMSGYQQLVRGELMRGRFRDSYERPAPFLPGEITKIEFTEPDVNHTFKRGHRIMIQVQSSWFPLADINPQKFVDIYSARSADFQKATQRLYHSAAAASRVDVQVLNRKVIK
jgi:uncharacterized protein